MALVLADLRDLVAQELGMLGQGADLTGEDATMIEGAITHRHEYLMARGWAQWDLTAIPEQAVSPLVTIMAADLRMRSRQRPEVMAELRDSRQEAYGELQALAAAEETTGEPVQAEYF